MIKKITPMAIVPPIRKVPKATAICCCYRFDYHCGTVLFMDKGKLSDSAQEWLQVIKMSPEVWAEEGILEHALDRDGVSDCEKKCLFKALQSLLPPSPE